MNNFDVVIGLEIHAELNTKTKLFCGCANDYTAEPNTNCCPVCLGDEDAAQQLNRAAIEKSILAGLSAGCTIGEVNIWDRKHYDYADMPKGYQISQLTNPICLGGEIKLKSGKTIRLERIHLEEDTAKLYHNQARGISMIDFNRIGVPLIETVTKPDISNSAEAVEFLEALRERFIFSGAADCKMEQGGLRCDVNLSLRVKRSNPKDPAAPLGVRTEIKNLNSFKSVARAIEYEAKRQAEVLDSGGKINCETRKWDDAKGKTIKMRDKDEHNDYGAFPDPRIPKLIVTGKDVEQIKLQMPILAHQLREKFITEYALPEYDANILTRTRELAFYFIDCVKLLNKPKAISNWIMTDLLARSETITISAKHLTEIIKLVEEKTITKLVGLQLLDSVIASGSEAIPPIERAKELGLLATIKDDQILAILTQLKKDNPKVAEDYLSRPDRVKPFIIGQVMKQTRGQAKSDIVEKLIAKMF